jgi:hypothetical protein
MRINYGLGTFFLVMVFVFSLLQDVALAQNELDFSLDPSRVRVTGKAGETLEFSITAYNNGTEPLEIQVEINDMLNEPDDEGSLERVYVPAGTVSVSLAKWMTLSEDSFVLEPKTRKAIPFILAVPPEAQGVYYSVIFFRGTSMKDDASDVDNSKPTTTVRVQPRLGSLVFCEIEGTVKRTGMLLDLNYDLPNEDEPLVIRYEMENTGNTDLLLTGIFYIMDDDQTLVAKETLVPIRLFPGDSGKSVTEWAGELEPGSYHMIVNIELGPQAQEVILKEFDFTIAEDI